VGKEAKLINFIFSAQKIYSFFPLNCFREIIANTFIFSLFWLKRKKTTLEIETVSKS